MTGVVLAGGMGTRLGPVTKYVNKHILPVGQFRMVAHAIYTLLASGIKKIVVVTGPPFGHQIIETVKRLSVKGARITFAIQKKPYGIPDAIYQAKDYVGNDSIIMVGGDNIFGGTFKKFIRYFKDGAVATLRKVDDPTRHGVPAYNSKGVLIDILEKPKKYSGRWAICSPNLFDNRVFGLINTLKPSARGELEIVDLLKKYLETSDLHLIKTADYWRDVGELESLTQVANDITNKRIKFAYDHF